MRSLYEIWDQTLLDSNPATEEIPVDMFREAFNSGKTFLEFAIEIQRNELMWVQNEILKSVLGYCEDVRIGCDIKKVIKSGS